MENFFFELFGIPPWIFNYLLLPLLIFLARIMDVSINTIRIIFVMSGRRGISTFLGFFESFIWLMAIGQIFQHIDNVASYIAYPAGFAAGIYVGMRIEEKLALGKLVIRIITRSDIEALKSFLMANKFRHSVMDANGPDGKESIVFTVIKREDLTVLVNKIKETNPTAFYTVESVKSANEAGILPERPSRRGIGTWLSSEKRK